MGEAKRKAEGTPDISVLIPSRGRPDMLTRCIASLGNYPNVEILVGLDEDDKESESLTWPAAGLGHVTFCTAPRFPTLAACINNLAQGSKGRWLFVLCDDVVIHDPEWPAKIVAAGAMLPRGFGVMHPRDGLHPDFPSMPIISRHMYNALGYMMAPHFPFWFTDTWWDEIGYIIGQKKQLDFAIQNPEGKGKTHGMRDISFWVDFFDATRPMRVKDALKVAKLAYDTKDKGLQSMMAELPQRQRDCAKRIEHMKNPRAMSDLEVLTDAPPTERYAEVKEAAEKLFDEMRASHPRRLRVAICCPSGRQIEAGTAMDIAALVAFSTLHGIEIMTANLQSSMISNSRNGTVELALKNNADYLMWIDSDMKFPPDTLLRLLKHGKDIVGSTYNKRVPPYETLGKLKGAKPDSIDGGLHEALLLPGGMLLVNAMVYKKLSWPWYFEAYKWPGADGLQSFKGMMRDYFWQRPTEEILASIDGTKFGDWVKENYRLGEIGEPFIYWSEDLAMCRKARRAGYEIWCDLDLTYEVVHLGTLDVTCKRPEVQAGPEGKPYSAMAEV